MGACASDVLSPDYSVQASNRYISSWLANPDRELTINNIHYGWGKNANNYLESSEIQAQDQGRQEKTLDRLKSMSTISSNLRGKTEYKPY